MSCIHIERYFLVFYKEYRLQTPPQECQSTMIKLQLLVKKEKWNQGKWIWGTYNTFKTEDLRGTLSIYFLQRLQQKGQLLRVPTFFPAKEGMYILYLHILKGKGPDKPKFRKFIEFIQLQKCDTNWRPKLSPELSMKYQLHLCRNLSPGNS